MRIWTLVLYGIVFIRHSKSVWEVSSYVLPVCLAIIGAGCATTVKRDIEAPSEDRAARFFIDRFADFRFEGRASSSVTGEPVTSASILFVDIGMGALYGRTIPIGLSDREGRISANLHYFWGLQVYLPPDLRAVAEDSDFMFQVSEFIGRKHEFFEVWIVKDGYETAKKTYEFSNLTSNTDGYHIDLGEVILAVDERKVLNRPACETPPLPDSL